MCGCPCNDPAIDRCSCLAWRSECHILITYIMIRDFLIGRGREAERGRGVSRSWEVQEMGGNIAWQQKKGREKRGEGTLPPTGE